MRFGLVGYGFGGRYFHAPLLMSAPGIDFAGVVTRSVDRRAELETDHPGVAAYDSLPALAADGVRAVAISTPADTHIPLALEAIGLGMAVVVDKPFAMDAAQARTAIDAAERAGVALSVYQNRRWDSDLLTVRRLIESGALGEVSRFESRFERFSPDPGPPAAGGGTLRDFGAHLVDQALLLFGPADHVYARMAARHRLDDDFFVTIAHTGGVQSHLWGSWVQGAPGPRFRVTGTTGTYIVDGVDGQEAALVAGRTPATEGERWGAEPESRWGRLHRGGPGEPVPTERGRWDTYYPAFAAAVRGDAAVPVDPRDVVRATEVLDAARVSAATGTTISL
ncbi:Gfo/Idh/MocA family oxidoreductase [Asanoa sp. NPDC049573]|uniref:Gfo/Idh/MocA family protein n=1 Tax=Asanoa sp. NPDC049573 TaxID=3155396 RepID=UPI00343B4C82